MASLEEKLVGILNLGADALVSIIGGAVLLFCTNDFF
jgi:uncharacterized membrane protein